MRVQLKASEADVWSTHARPADVDSTTAALACWRRLAADLARVGGSTAICQVLGLGAALVFRALLDPAQMGIWQALKMFLSYGNYFNLGASKGAVREWSIAIGHGRTAEAARGLDLAFTFNTLSSLVYAGLLAAAGAVIAWSGDPAGRPWAVGLALLGVIVVFQRHVTFHVSILRASHDFSVTSRLAVLEAALTLAVGSIAVWAMGVYGLYMTTIAVLALSWWFVVRGGARRLRLAWDTARIRSLVAMGSPMLLAGIATTLLRSVDKLVLLAWGVESELRLGCYSLALLVAAQIYATANALSTVLGPRYGSLLGSTGSRNAVVSYASRVSALHAAVLGLVGGLAIVAAPALLGRLFPAYATGLPAIPAAVLGGIAWGIALPSSQLLVALGHERRALAALIPPLLLTAAGGWTVLKLGGDLAGLAAVAAVGYWMYAAIAFGFAFSSLGKYQCWRVVAYHAIALLPTGVALALAEPSQAAASDDPAVVLAHAALVLLAGTGVAWLGWSRGRWSAIWRKELAW